MYPVIQLSVYLTAVMLFVNLFLSCSIILEGQLLVPPWRDTES